MNTPDSLSSRGEHRGDAEHEASTNVRAQQPPSAASQHRSARVFQLLQNAEDGSYQVRTWIAGQEADAPKGFAERGRYTSIAPLTDALHALPDAPHHVACEKVDSGDTRRARLDDLSPEDWTHYDRFMLS